MRLLLDADAVLAMSKLSLWELLLAAEVELFLTGYVACHELSTLWSARLEPLVHSGRIRVEDVIAKTPAYSRRRELQKAGADKGEAEAVAWATGIPLEKRPTFVSCDARARELAASVGVEAIDLGDLAALLIVEERATETEVTAKIATWDDTKQQQGRPARWTTVAASLPERKRRFTGDP